MKRLQEFEIDDFLSIAKALSDPHRVRALMALRGGELCVCQIIELLALAPSTVSKHMSVLKQAGLVDSRKDSRWVYYRMTEEKQKRQPNRRMIELAISLLENDEQINRDDSRLAEIATISLAIICKRQRGPNKR